MNSIPEYVASRTLRDASWNATVIAGDLVQRVAEISSRTVGAILRYGTGPIDALLMAHGLTYEFHLLITPVALGRGQHLFEDVEGSPHLHLIGVIHSTSGVVALIYTPINLAA